MLNCVIYTAPRCAHSATGILRAALMSQMVGGDHIGALEFNATPGSESSATFTKDLSSITVCGFIYNHSTDQPSGIGRKLEGMENRERLFLEQTEQGTLRSPDLDNLLYSLKLNSENSNDELGNRLKFKDLFRVLRNKPKSSRQRVGLIGRLSERVPEPEISDSAYRQKTPRTW
jgi:hypothetical protein